MQSERKEKRYAPLDARHERVVRAITLVDIVIVPEIRELVAEGGKRDLTWRFGCGGPADHARIVRRLRGAAHPL